MTAEVRLELNGPVATIVIDHPARRNAMTVDMWRTVPELCRRIEADPEVRVVVLRGAGQEAFVAGADISEFAEVRQGDRGAEYDRMTAEATESLRRIRQPLVALIHGFCIGGGLALALSADLRYAADDATFGLPPARLGIGYGHAGVGHLVDIVGPAAAMELLFTAEWIHAEKAARWGLVNEVVSATELDRYVEDRVAVMISRAPLSQQAAKQSVAVHLSGPDGGNGNEVEALIAACYRSNDYREGVAAFLEKRAPRFTGT